MECGKIVKDGRIDLDSKFGKKIGFTSDKFNSSWLWKIDNYIYISMIISNKENKGYVTTLFNNILKEGYGVKVPTPFSKMVSICVKHGFKHIVEHGEEGPCDIMIKDSCKGVVR